MESGIMLILKFNKMSHMLRKSLKYLKKYRSHVISNGICATIFLQSSIGDSDYDAKTVKKKAWKRRKVTISDGHKSCFECEYTANSSSKNTTLCNYDAWDEFRNRNEM